MQTKKKLASLALALACSAVGLMASPPSATIVARMRSGTVVLPFLQKPSTVSTFSTSGTTTGGASGSGFRTVGYSVGYNLQINPTSDAGGTYRFTVSTLTATVTGTGMTLAGSPQVDIEGGGSYSQGQQFTVRYWQSVKVARIRIPVAGWDGGALMTFIDLTGVLTAPGYPHWDLPGEYVQSVIGGYPYTSANWWDRSYYGNPSTGAAVQFQVMEWRANCFNLVQGNAYYLEFHCLKRPAGGSTWYYGDPIRISFVASGTSDTSAWVGSDYVPRNGPCWEYLFYEVAISGSPFADAQTPTP